MQFGAMNFPILPLMEEIETFARFEFDYLELAMDPPMAHHSIISSNRNAIFQALKDSGLGLVCHLPTFLSTADLTESIRLASVMEMHQSLSVAADLGAKKVVLHPSTATGMGALVPDTVKKHTYDFLAGMVEKAREYDITICLENMFPRNLMGVEPADFAEIFSIFPTLKLTLDTGHANIDDWLGRRLKTLSRDFAKRIGHLHCSDNNGRRDDHLAIGEGTINFKKLVKTLKAVGYDDTITLEVFDENRAKLVAGRDLLATMFSR